MNNDEKKIVGANYLYSFYLEVEGINKAYSAYKQSLLFIEEQKKQTEEEYTLEDTDKALFNNQLQIIKQLVIITYIRYASISASIGKTDLKDFEEKYKKVLNNYVTEETSLLSYLQELNKFLVNEVIQNLLYNSKEILNSFMVDNGAGNTTTNTDS
jgi:hypothetical protein